MALAFPYGLNFLANCIQGPSISLDLVRNEERSGSGDGRFWSAELSPPLWSVSYDLYAKSYETAREINAKIRALDGMKRTFYWADPYYPGPKGGSEGVENVTVNTIRASDRGGIGFTGLPPGYEFLAGDLFTIRYANDKRTFLGEFSEGGQADVNGMLTSKEIRPYLPHGIEVGAIVDLTRPYFEAMVTSYTPFSLRHADWGAGARISLLQKP